MKHQTNLVKCRRQTQVPYSRVRVNLAYVVSLSSPPPHTRSEWVQNYLDIVLLRIPSLVGITPCSHYISTPPCLKLSNIVQG